MSVLATCTEQAVLDWERSQLGIAEEPPGSNMQPYGADYGWNGVAWCQIFQWDAQVHAGNTGFFKTASTRACAAWFQKNGAWLANSSTPPAGSLIFFDWGQGIAHVGMFEGLLPDGRLCSIEGNTDTAGGGSGGRVMRQYRSRALIAGFGVITYAPSAPEEDDMAGPYVFQLSQDIVYENVKIPAGTAFVQVADEVEHVPDPAHLDSLKGDGLIVHAVGPYQALVILKMTNTDVQHLQQT